MTDRLTDKRAVWVALCTAVLWEESLIDAYTVPDYYDQPEEMNVEIEKCKRRIAAFERVAQRYYGRSISDTLNEPFKGAKKVEVHTLRAMLMEQEATQ